MRRMRQLSEPAIVSNEQGQDEIAQLLAIGVVRVLLQQNTHGKLDSESVKPETSDDGLEDS
jgi:hypothetical protein